MVRRISYLSMFRYKNDHKRNQSLDYTKVQEEHLEYFVVDSDETPIGWSAIHLVEDGLHAAAARLVASWAAQMGPPEDWAEQDCQCQV